MAQITCAYSGVLFACEHLPFAISSREIAHPLFSVDKKRLLGLAGRWSNNELSHTESYLLYLSLLHSTGLIEWRVPAKYTPKTSSIVANNMEQLIHIVGKIDVIKHPSFVLPHFVISDDTSTLDNSYHWIQLWMQNYNDWIEQTKSHYNDQELMRRELALEKLIKTSHRKIEDYPKILAAWAETAADFPTFAISINGKYIEKSEYWKSLILKCAKEDTIWNVNRADLKELIDHCENVLIAPVDDEGKYTIGEGSLHATALMKYLRKGAKMHDNYLGLGDIDLAATEGTAYRILKPNESAEDANIQNMIDTAPLTEPQKNQYPDLMSYIKAKSRWMVAQAHSLGAAMSAKQTEISNVPPETPEEEI